MSTTRPLLEVIAMGPEDARAAERGGADRLELVREIGVGGLTPDVAVFAQIRAATKLPLRVMLRSNGGFTATEAEVAQLCHEAAALRREGADQFVLGFLDGAKLLDLGAIKALVAAIAPCPWTLHHAFDHAADQRAAWEAALTLPRVDHVLSGGIRGDLSAGSDLLCGRVDWQTPGLRWLAGGGMTLDYVAPLRAAGLERDHVGKTARFGHDWAQPVSEEAVRGRRQALDAPVGQG